MENVKDSIVAKLALFSLMGIGVWVGLTLDWDPILARAEALTHTWWLPPSLMIAQASAFALAMPGSIMFVIIGLLYNPLPAAAMITVGSVTGSVLGYFFSQKLGHAWIVRLQKQHLYQVLQNNTSFLMLCAVRTLPGFPHSVINYGSGLLRVPLTRFTGSAFVGYVVKGILYATALHNVVEAEDGESLLSMDVLWPLAVLAILFVAGFVFQKFWIQHKRK